jgi:TPR repeat protein
MSGRTKNSEYALVLTVCFASFGALACSPAKTGQASETKNPSSPLTANESIARPSAVEDLVGRCPHLVTPRETCAHLREQAILFCDEQNTNPCMESLIRFEGNHCDPAVGTKKLNQALEYACANGSWTSCAWLSAGLSKSGDQASRERAWHLAKQACDNKNAEGCANAARIIAWWYGKGQPRDEDLALAMALVKQACDLGSSAACNDYALGLVQRHQPGDTDEAKGIFERQCRDGFEPSCVTLGVQEKAGAFGPVNIERARTLWRKACSCGNMDGCGNTAKILLNSGQKDAGLRLMEHACANDHYGTCADLGRIYSEGTLVPRDVSRARSYFKHACELDDWKACEALKTSGQSSDGRTRR